ncbi:uncharacterized protein LOC129607424 [Condylostylus longicornis]|uniref:uncharacterized protein LOC129607424 n=1 Tax=Condylostylus longicornis TaxID=2530218 RepID=UPI00244DB130|nr:uncharacterized protein LOC129607424 [Condylostylus longicornis]
MNYDSKYAWIYFLLSAFVTFLILLLLFLTMQVVVYDQRKIILKDAQELLQFIKPKTQFITNYYGHQWNYIGDAKYGHQIYSAYFDPRTELYNNKDYNEEFNYYGAIRIMAFLPIKLRNGLTCIIKSESNNTYEIKASEIRRFHKYEDIEGDFAFYMIMCPLFINAKATIVKLPAYVALTYMENPSSVTSPTFILINFSKNRILDKPRDSLAICVGSTGLNHNYTNTLNFIEFIELYKLLGAEKFYFYHFNASHNMIQALNYYLREGVIKINNWNFNIEQYEPKTIHITNIAAQNFDCIYRTYLDGFKYTAIVDIDEIIIPFEYNNLTDFINAKDEGRSSAFIFRKVLFYKKRPSDYFNVPPNIKNKNLLTQIKIQKTETPLPQGKNSKYIAKGDALIEAGINGIWKSTEGHTETHVKSDEALIFNYRTSCIGNTCGANTVTDFTLRRFGSLIWYNVENICKIIFLNGICAL